MGTEDETSGCGTYAAFQRHRRSGETPCIECRRAYNAYMRAYRKDPAVMARHEAMIKAREMAHQALAYLHPDEYQRLRDDALRQLRETTTW